MISTVIAPEYDPGRGILRCRLRTLDALVRNDIAAATDELQVIGAWSNGRPDPGVAAVAAAIRDARCRFTLRTDQGSDVRRHRGWISSAGIVTVTGDPEPDLVQDVRTASAPQDLARLLARLVDLGPSRAPCDAPSVGPDDDTNALSWEDVVALTTGSEPAALHHLRWASRPDQEAVTVLIFMASNDAHGYVEVCPDPDHAQRHRLIPRQPRQLWGAFTALARMAAVSSATT